MTEIVIELPEEIYAAFEEIAEEVEKTPEEFAAVLLAIGVCLWQVMAEDAIEMAADIYEAAQQGYALRLGGVAYVAERDLFPENN